MNFSSYVLSFQAFNEAPYELPDHPFMTTPDGVSATSHINADVNDWYITPIYYIRQVFFEKFLSK